jgi:hypothetical protein
MSDKAEGNLPESPRQAGFQAHLLERAATRAADADGGFSDECVGQTAAFFPVHGSHLWCILVSDSGRRDSDSAVY